MWFHSKEKENVDLARKYEVLCGIEEEFLILDRDGTLIEAADNLMVKAAQLLEDNSDLLDSLRLRIRSLDAEPNPAQIEYVTLPLKPSQLEDAVKAGRKLLIDAGKKLDVKIFTQSLHPVQSDPHPIVGTHINVSVQKKENLMKSEELKAVHNYLWNMLPEIISLSANSPIYQGKKNNIATNRCANSTVLKPNGFAQIQIPEEKPALVPMQYYGRMRYQLKIGSGEDEFSKKVITNKRGERLVDLTPRGPFTNIQDDKDESPSRNRVEIRVIDVQHHLEDILDIAYLCCYSGLHAIDLANSGKMRRDPHHKENLDKAISKGANASFKRENGEYITFRDSLRQWIQETSQYGEILGVKIKNLPDTKFERKSIQEELGVEFQTRKIEKIRQQGNVYATVILNESRIVENDQGEKYKVTAGRPIQGELAVKYNLDYEEEDELVKSFRNIKITNMLNVQGLSIPLKLGDRVQSVQSRQESLLERLLGGFGF
ncbi:MAG: putative metal-dependent hydrolase of the TIM-barrel fold [Promethearchaeota archaeon]|nr:MAG: putative metal-dependent hydrolase of the TIM-barrel fold [Candidatus Lokiarchaeota archaeon]